MIDKERLEAYLNNGEVELIMCAAIHVDDDVDSWETFDRAASLFNK